MSAKMQKTEQHARTKQRPSKALVAEVGNATGDTLHKQWASSYMNYLHQLAYRLEHCYQTLNERGNQMLKREQAGSPPVLDFEYEVIMDGREFEQPVNYALLRVTTAGNLCWEDCVKEGNQPLMVFDPRAGHGPGIGGFKPESEIGVAMHFGYPVYFVAFYRDPQPEQTLPKILHAFGIFIDEVTRRHPKSDQPILYGNCQAGWALALLMAHQHQRTNPIVLNGSPLSYWGGEQGVNPMRLNGMLGGVWPADYLSDLAGGQFDGAWLVQNFERLNPGNAWWDKYQTLLADPDKEKERFLTFEKWWNGFIWFNQQEIHDIVTQLFMGNDLEQGELRLCDDCVVDLKKIQAPMVIFSSYGDNITPPHQALGWLKPVFGNDAQLKQNKQRIVYLLQKDVGHLGIFVSGAVAKLEHRAIMEHVDDIERLKPGLYQMNIENPTQDPDCRKDQYKVKFQPTSLEVLQFPDSGEGFASIERYSQWNDALYRFYGHPFARTIGQWPGMRLWQKWAHPMRMRVYAWADFMNPGAAALRGFNQAHQEDPQAIDKSNIFYQQERKTADYVSQQFQRMTRLRDLAFENLFLFGWKLPATFLQTNEKPHAAPGD